MTGAAGAGAEAGIDIAVLKFAPAAVGAVAVGAAEVLGDAKIFVLCVSALFFVLAKTTAAFEAVVAVLETNIAAVAVAAPPTSVGAE